MPTVCPTAPRWSTPMECWQLKTAGFQSFVPLAQSISIPVQQLHPIAAAIDEHVQAAAGDFTSRMFQGGLCQPIKTTPQVCGLRAQINLHRQGEA